MTRALKLVPPFLPAPKDAFTGDDAALVQGFRRGDPRARAALYDRYADHVHRVLYRVLGFDRDLPDLHHDVFVRALGSLPNLEDPSALKGWLTMIAVHVAHSWSTRRKRRSWLWFLPDEELPEVESRAAPGEVLDALRATYAVLDTLPVDERIAFALRFIDGMELTEVAAAARADETSERAPSTIAVLSEPGDHFGLRVVAELELLGFHAVIIDPAAEPASRASLEATARKVGAIAAIRAVPSARGVEVWIADRVTGKTVLREVASDDRAPDADGALAIRAVELLRASLLEVALPMPPPGEVPATPEIRAKMQLPAPGALAEKPAPTLRLSLAPGVMLSPGGFGPAASVNIGLDWMPSEHVGLTGLAAIPLSYPGVERSQGRVDLRALFAGAGVRFLFTTRASRWGPSVDIGMTAVSLRSTGLGNAGFRSGASSAVTVAPFARAGLAFAVTPLFRLRADLLGSVIVQGVSVQIAKHDVATWGKPVILSSVGVDFGWF